MSKEEFLDGLRSTLTGEIPDSEVRSNIIFYDDYIRENSKTIGEEAVIEKLGDPRLIAKTIIETYQISHGPLYNNAKSNKAYQDADTTNDWRRNDRENYEHSSRSNNGTNGRRGFKINIGGKLTWYQKVLISLIMIIVVFILLVIGGLILKLFFAVGLPIILILLIYALIFDNRRR